MKDSGGFTLIELIMVIVIVGLLSTVISTQVDPIVSVKRKANIRKFLTTWEFLYNQAIGRGESYRLMINVGENSSFYVLREVVSRNSSEAQEVDLLANLRTQGEKKRRAEKEAEETEDSLAEEFKNEDFRQSGQLETLFYQSVFGDPEGAVKLTTPLEFPSLRNEVKLPEGLTIRDVKTQRGKIDSGKTFIRFSGRGATDFAVVHFDSNGEILTATMNPSTGQIILTEDDIDYDWTLGKGAKKQS